ncbi:Wadjet anti-phage system protein JetD domain-containing protein [Pseudomonas sp. MDT1-17]
MWTSGITLFFALHGFAILDRLRRRFDHVESFLMDRVTLVAHKNLWGEEADQFVHDLPNLTEKERVLFDELRDNRVRNGLRLEQEYISYQWF